MTKLRLIYRLYGGQNLKSRPAGFDKLTCLASFLMAAEVARRSRPVDVVIVCDGPVPDRWLSVARPHSRVVDIPGGPVGMRRSYLAAIRLAVRSDWPADDLVYLSEDDYLFQPEAFADWAAAYDMLPKHAYTALYASTPDNPTEDPGENHSTPPGWRPAPGVRAGGRSWVNVPSTTSSFGARLGTLRSDEGVLFQGTLPSPRRILDHATALTLQGCTPFTADDLIRGPSYQRFDPGYRAVAQNAILLPFRLALNARAMMRRRRPHRLYAPDPNTACHQEIPYLSPGTDWAAVQAAAERWTGGRPGPSRTSDIREAQ